MANTTSSTPSSPNFKVGDKVVCIIPNWYLTKGHIYTITKIDNELDAISVKTDGLLWASYRFRLVSSPIYRRR